MFDPVQPLTRPDLLFLRMHFHFHEGVPDHHPIAAWQHPPWLGKSSWKMELYSDSGCNGCNGSGYPGCHVWLRNPSAWSLVASVGEQLNHPIKWGLRDCLKRPLFDPSQVLGHGFACGNFQSTFKVPRTLKVWFIPRWDWVSPTNLTWSLFPEAVFYRKTNRPAPYLCAASSQVPKRSGRLPQKMWAPWKIRRSLFNRLQVSCIPHIPAFQSDGDIYLLNRHLSLFHYHLFPLPSHISRWKYHPTFTYKTTTSLPSLLLTPTFILVKSPHVSWQSKPPSPPSWCPCGPCARTTAGGSWERFRKRGSLSSWGMLKRNSPCLRGKSPC